MTILIVVILGALIFAAGMVAGYAIGSAPTDPPWADLDRRDWLDHKVVDR